MTIAAAPRRHLAPLRLAARPIRAAFKVIAASSLALGLAAAAPARAETLTDALIAAYQNSHLLDQNRALLRAADEDVASAVASLRPVLSYLAQATKTYNNIVGWSDVGASLTLSAEIVLYDFGKSKLSVDLAKETVLSLREALVGVEQQVLLSAVQAYMNVIRAEQFVALRDNNMRLITEQLRAAKDRLDLGEGIVTDVALAQARRALAQAQLAAAQGDLFTSREQFRVVVGRLPGRLAPAPAAPATAKTLDAAKAIAVKTHPDVLRAQREVTIAELSIAIAEAALRPTLSGNLRGTIVDGGTRTASVGIQLSGPIYSGGAISASIRKAIARRDAARAGLLQTVALVQQNVALAWAQVTVASAQLQAGDEQVRAARVAYRGTSDKAQLGEATTLDVLDSEQELLDAEANRISAYTTYYTATYSLLAAMGLLTVDHLRLGIPTYDPGAYYNAVKDAPVRRVSPQGQKLDRVLKSLGRN